MITSVTAIQRFQLERVLNEDPITHALTLLGQLPIGDSDESATAIVRIEKTALSGESAGSLLSGIPTTRMIESTDIYSWFFGWLAKGPDPDVKINIIHPATEVHIRKYSRQDLMMVHETPDLYDRIVKPYITAFPPSRPNALSQRQGRTHPGGTSKRESSLRDPSPEWDLTTIGSLYLMAITFNRNIRSLRDLTKAHIPMLTSIRREGARVAQEKWGLASGSLRMFIHYQPSYYHFHVHIVNANYVGLLGMSAGQAHLLDDVISLLECSPDDGPSILQKMTLTYNLGDQHGLYEPMKAAQQELGWY
ncbi:scavenger mRNA decapping enzyme [Epithele typhae]|uniref:scavenger mRNA decapping enzyme n=1 Tax=Epithele typhae TaxID=378194 RepID=UPI002008899F|nr:scavenger mRNA decapping enzyme [Epithele typhae]KAH9918749.1 scavenger mRNA decapping enzyme [Epithele typhae]